jgi:hypothetical protein
LVARLYPSMARARARARGSTSSGSARAHPTSNLQRRSDGTGCTDHMQHATCNMRHATCDVQHATHNMQHTTCNTEHATHNMAGAREALQGRGSHVAITGASYGAHMPCGLQSVRLGADSPAVEGVHGAGMLCERECDGRNQPRLLLLVMLPDLRTARHDAMCNAQHATCTRQQPCNVQHRAFSSFFHAAACHATPPHPTPPHANPRRTPARRGAHSIPARTRRRYLLARIPFQCRYDSTARSRRKGSHRRVRVHRPQPQLERPQRDGTQRCTRVLHVVRCALSVARCLSHVVRCTLRVARCPLHVVRCALHVFRCTLSVARYPLHVSTTKRGTAVARCRLHVARCLLNVACCLSHVVC